MNKQTPQPLTDESAQKGPKPDLLKIDFNWEDAIKQSLEKKKPATG